MRKIKMENEEEKNTSEDMVTNFTRWHMQLLKSLLEVCWGGGGGGINSKAKEKFFLALDKFYISFTYTFECCSIVNCSADTDYC